MQIYNSMTGSFDEVNHTELNKRDEIIFTLDTSKYPLHLLNGMIAAVCNEHSSYALALYIKENKIYLKHSYNHYRSSFIRAFPMFIAGYQYSLGIFK